MGYLWIPATVLAFLAIFLSFLFGAFKYSALAGTGALIIIALVCGWYIHGGVTERQAMNYYYSGEANGYNRGYQVGITQQLGTSDNSSIFYDLPPTHFNPWDFD